MNIEVPNTHTETPFVTLFGKLKGGAYTAEVMNETSVPYSHRWRDAEDQVVVYINPDRQQLAALVDALNEGRLDYESLQNYGSAIGGTSTIPA